MVYFSVPKENFMNNAWKGLLFSGLVLPGSGQMILKHHLRGVMFLTAVVVGLVALMMKAYRIALDIVEQTTPTLNNFDIDQIYSAANQAIIQVETSGLSFALLVIVVAWLASAVDAYFLGRRMDKQAAAQAQDVDRSH
jgi:CDP-diglyceride synthetase